jgi:hypothetical protein
VQFLRQSWNRDHERVRGKQAVDLVEGMRDEATRRDIDGTTSPFDHVRQYEWQGREGLAFPIEDLIEHDTGHVTQRC